MGDGFQLNGDLLVSDNGNRRIQVFGREGQYRWALADGTGPGGFRIPSPRGLFADGLGRIYVTTGWDGCFILDEYGGLLAAFDYFEQPLEGFSQADDIGMLIGRILTP